MALWFSCFGTTRDVFLIIPRRYHKPLGTHCNPSFLMDLVDLFFFVSFCFFKGAAHGRKPLVSMFHWPSERLKLHRRAWLHWHRQCQRHHGTKRTTWSQKSLATGAIRFSWLDKLRQTWCFADILYQCWINDGFCNHSTTRQHLHLFHMYLFRIKPQFTNHSSRDFEFRWKRNTCWNETCACWTSALQEALHLLT